MDNNKAAAQVARELSKSAGPVARNLGKSIAAAKKQK